MEAWYGLFDAIDSGQWDGSQEITVQVGAEKVRRLFRVDFLGIPDENEGNIGAMIACEDITDQAASERIRQQAEELALTMGQMGKHVSYYNILCE